jgi:hypothetical protein
MNHFMIINYHLHCSFSELGTEQDFLFLHSSTVKDMTDQPLGNAIAHLAGYDGRAEGLPPTAK